MTFLELLIHIASSTEIILAHRSTEIITDKKRYSKDRDGWKEDVEPGKAVEFYDRSGKTFVWKKNVEIEPEKKETVISDTPKG